MHTRLPLRRLVGGVPCTLLAMLLVLARLLAPAMAAPHPGAALSEFDSVARASICHAVPDDAGVPAEKAPLDHGACLVCPACHLAAAMALPVPDGPCPLSLSMARIGLSAPPPFATGPPSRKLDATPPTGPPAHSA